MEDMMRSGRDRTETKRLTAVLVSVSLVSVGLVTVAPSAAATAGCGGISIGGHDSDNLLHLCVDASEVWTTKTVPSVEGVECPTCVPGSPSVDETPPSPPTGDLDFPGISPPWYPGTPDNDNCVDNTVCHPSVSEIISWAVAYAQGWLEWTPSPRCTTSCYTPPSGSSVDDFEQAATAWAGDNVDSVRTWAENQADRIVVGSETVDAVQDNTGTTHVDPHGNGAKPVLDEVCQVIYGDGAQWEDCEPSGGPGEPSPCDRTDDCYYPRTSVAVGEDNTPGLLIETDTGEVFVPAAELT